MKSNIKNNIKNVGLGTILSIFGLLLFLGSCQKEPLPVFSNDDVSVDSLVKFKMYSNHYMLLADGKAQLDLKPYVWKQLKNDTILMKEDRIKDDWIEYHEINEGINVNRYFSTPDASLIGKELRIYATIKGTNLVSDTTTVTIEAPLPDDAYDVVTYPVIFHIVQTPQEAEERYQVTEKTVNDLINRMNRVFSGNAVNTPMGVDTKVRFAAAKYDPNGELLKEIGINRYKDTLTISPLRRDVATGEYTEPRSNQRYDSFLDVEGINLHWPQDKYLNIWLISYGGSRPFSIYSSLCFPTRVNPGVTDWPQVRPKRGSGGSGGVPTVPTSSDWWKLKTLTINDHNNPTFTGMKIELQSLPKFVDDNKYTLAGVQDFMTYVGVYFGLEHTFASTSWWSPYYVPGGDNDYCDDTFNYTFGENKEVKRINVNGGSYEFVSENIMDSREGRHRSISKAQAQRIRWFIENCPRRTAYKSDFALTGIE
ncbi:hypothetical protein VOI54_17525 [Tamlana sp. 2201CG12-4]|uniref:hypothetical protein n=1 Tax=Tamlana sp. 2201CG12-4 TaxID=3112582 RepID=UPI002DB86D9A|nr:hypothetical protein [Tamlana sp. 2201CG12-4]MEC3908832.1 hypothetical protein [Tamlana sp. 2201CG12-4]